MNVIQSFTKLKSMLEPLQMLNKVSFADFSYLGEEHFFSLICKLFVALDKAQ